MGAMIEPPLGVPDMPPVLDALAALGPRRSTGIIEHDLYPCAPDVPLPIAKRTRPTCSSCSGAPIDLGTVMSVSVDLRVAVLGVGMMGAFHADALDHPHQGRDGHGDQRLRPPTRPPRSPRRIGARVVDDPFAAIADPEVDAVLIATPGRGPRRSGPGLPRRRQAGALREAADHRHRVLVRAGAGRGHARPAAGPARLHAALRRRVRRAARPDHLGRAGQPAARALHAPQPGRARALQLRVHDPRLRGARGRRRPVPARRGDHLGAGAPRRGHLGRAGRARATR